MTAPDRNASALPVARAAELDVCASQARWLVRDLWSRQAVGVIAGRPKLGKSWLGLDLALSVASRTPCLGHFEVDDPGRALVYLAEDAQPAVRERLAGLCAHRGLDLGAVDLFVITAAALRLDLARDQQRLRATVAELQPKLLLLDPLVRLHRLDENDSGAISGLLGFLRELQRDHSVAVALVHHMTKRSSADLGLALRGSGDIHAWTDSSAFLTRRAQSRIALSTEHRSVAAIDPFDIELVADGPHPHLEIVTGPPCADSAPTSAGPELTERIVEALREADRPLRRGHLRQTLAVNNQRLGSALDELLRAGCVERCPEGWSLADTSSALAH